MKKLAWILVATVAIALLVAPAVAFANNGPHGGYVSDTDMCAACHRAHTAPSSITWTDNQGAQRNALLLSDSAQAYLFCLACHDAGAQGADTNVVDGVYEGNKYGTTGGAMISGPFGGADALKAKGALYATVGTTETTVTSTHLINGQSWGAYGGGALGVTDPTKATGDIVGQKLGMGNDIVMDCTTCHDPHGTSNYRLLKAAVNGVTVGGYDSSSNPTPYVVSNEKGFPLAGFALHTSYPTYQPDYTKAQYAQPPAGDTTKGMTGWCVGCHTVYATKTSAYNAGDGAGLIDRHRHPMNVPMSNYSGQSSLTINALPLDQSQNGIAGVAQGGSSTNASSDWIECLTCHDAHGSTAVMTGYADPTNPISQFSDPSTSTVINLVVPDSALLKLNNRGVCEVCHNK